MTITEFLEARITEDVAVARAAEPGPWYVDDEEQTVRAREYAGEIMFDRSAECRSEWLENFKPGAEYIARNDPSRVLAECAAKRVVIEAHPPYYADPNYDRSDVLCGTCGLEPEEECYPPGAVEYPCPTLKALAAVYKDHPDYRQEWAL